ncbi:MAG: DUF11 domain-containing protein [Pirellulaceae bacterium]
MTRAHDAATGVTVLDKLPVGFAVRQANTASGSYSSESGVWTVGGLPVGGTSSLTIVAKLTDRSNDQQPGGDRLLGSIRSRLDTQQWCGR